MKYLLDLEEAGTTFNIEVCNGRGTLEHCIPDVVVLAIEQPQRIIEYNSSKMEGSVVVIGKSTMGKPEEVK